MKPAPEQFRVTKEIADKYRFNEKCVTDESYGNNGVFSLPRKGKTGHFFFCIISCGEGWEHVSVSLRSGEPRCPTWEEMCYIKSIFWDDEEPVMQLHPPKSMWVSNHPYCLHLWRPIGQEIPLPDETMVGLKTHNTEVNKTT